MYKRSLALLLLLVLLLPLAGSFFLFQYRQIAIKKELKRKIKRGLPDSELISMVLTPEILNSKSFEWHNSHEFRLNGRMYDIIKTNKKGNQTEYKVVWDNDESELFSQLESDLKEAFSNDPIQKSNGFKFYSFLKQLYHIDNQNNLNQINLLLYSKNEFCEQGTKTLYPPFLQNIAPPPERFFIL